MSYRKLEIYRISFELFLKAPIFFLQLPAYELYELGSQLRRSADSVHSSIAERYGRRKYKKDFVRFLTFSHASNKETINHLNKLKKLYPQFPEIVEYIKKYDHLGRKINSFIQYVIKNRKT